MHLAGMSICTKLFYCVLIVVNVIVTKSVPPQYRNAFQLHFTRVVTRVFKTCDKWIVVKTSDFVYYTTHNALFQYGRKSSYLNRSMDY